MRRLAALRVSDRPFVGGIPMSENRSNTTLVVNREGEFADAENLRGRGRVRVEVELRYRSRSSGRRAPPTDPFDRLSRGSDQPIVLPTAAAHFSRVRDAGRQHSRGNFQLGILIGAEVFSRVWTDTTGRRRRNDLKGNQMRTVLPSNLTASPIVSNILTHLLNPSTSNRLFTVVSGFFSARIQGNSSSCR